MDSFRQMIIVLFEQHLSLCYRNGTNGIKSVLIVRQAFPDSRWPVNVRTALNFMEHVSTLEVLGEGGSGSSTCWLLSYK